MGGQIKFVSVNIYIGALLRVFFNGLSQVSQPHQQPVYAPSQVALVGIDTTLLLG